MAVSLPGTSFVNFVKEIPEFGEYFSKLNNQQEAYAVAVAAVELQPKRTANWRDGILERVKQAQTTSLAMESSLQELDKLQPGWKWHMSTPGVPGVPVGTPLERSDDKLPSRPKFLLPYRLIALPEGVVPTPTVKTSELVKAAENRDKPAMDLQQLGILEDDHLHDESRYPTIRGKGAKREALAVCEMIALHQQVPFRRDAIIKVLESQFRRDKGITLELIGGLCELLGLTSQLAETASVHINSVEGPAVFFLNEVPVVFYGISKGQLNIAHPHYGIQK